MSTTMISRITALAAASGYWTAAIWLYMASATEALWPPLIMLTTKKSPITSVMTKIEPSAIPVLRQRDDDLPDDAPAAAAAVERRLDDRAVDAGHGVEDRHDHEQREQMHVGDDHREIREQQKLQRLVASRRCAISAWLKMPLRPRNGIHEIMRMMFEVQNGTVHSRNSAICHRMLRTWKTRKYDDREADHQRDRPDDQRVVDGLEVQRQRDLRG